jgi:hypothetical protein
MAQAQTAQIAIGWYQVHKSGRAFDDLRALAKDASVKLVIEETSVDKMTEVIRDAKAGTKSRQGSVTVRVTSPKTFVIAAAGIMMVSHGDAESKPYPQSTAWGGFPNPRSFMVARLSLAAVDSETLKVATRKNTVLGYFAAYEKDQVERDAVKVTKKAKSAAKRVAKAERVTAKQQAANSEANVAALVSKITALVMKELA